jgi:hypothetical protein
MAAAAVTRSASNDVEPTVALTRIINWVQEKEDRFKDLMKSTTNSHNYDGVNATIHGCTTDELRSTDELLMVQ